MSTVNPKATRLAPPTDAALPYIKGTEKPNYYLVLGEGEHFIYGFRPLATAVPPIGSAPLEGEETRVRVVPKLPEEFEKFGSALSILDFEKRDYGDGNVHYSTVTEDAPTLVEKVKKLLSLIG